jgi:hypothetical protein
MEENCCVVQNPKGIVVPTEDKVTVEQRKTNRENDFYILFHEIYITKNY